MRIINKLYDVIIIGAGVAGMNTALYCARNQMSVLILDKLMYGGSLLETSEIENYIGFENITGEELAEKMMNQVLSYSNVEYKPFSEVEHVNEALIGFDVKLKNGTFYRSKTVTVATGVTHKKLGVYGEDILAGKGVVYCTECDKLFFKDKNVIVVGGGNTAVESAVIMADIAKHVTLIHRRDTLRAEKLLVDRMLEKKNVEVMYDSIVESIDGQDKVKSVVVSSKTGTKTIDTDAVFINIGVDPSPLTYLPEYLNIWTENGYIATGSSMGTTAIGVFAVGDIRHDSIRQISTAVGDGAIAARSISKYLRKLEELI